MSLIDAPIAERRRWVAQVATKLYNLQKARFGYISQGQARERKLAWKVIKLLHGPSYIQVIAQTISHFDVNDLATLNTYWKILENAEQDQDFARLLTFDSLHPDSRPSTIVLNNDYIEVARVDVEAVGVENLVENYSIAKKQGKVISPLEFMGEISKYALGFGSFIMYNKMLQQGYHSLDNRMINLQTVPCVLAGLPLRHIREIEVARSGKILKFRATGSVFLANQEGGEDAIRIEGLFARGEIMFILFLWMIFYYGQGRIKEAVFDPNKEITLLAMRAKNVDITTFNQTTQKPAYTHHFTVPLVTRHIIIPNCYIETLSFEEKIEFGKDIIGYSILLRTYRKQQGFEVYTHSPKSSYLSPSGNKSLGTFKIIEFFANMAWRFINAEGLFISEREWKIGGDTAGSDDVYYNVEIDHLASSVILGVVGII